MARRLQVRDVNEPIERIVRKHLDRLGVATINHGPLVRDLQSEMNDVVRRAITETYDDAKLIVIGKD